MTPEVFDDLLNLVGGDIMKKNTNMRDAIPANVKLAATIRYLATGDSYSDLQYQFRVHAIQFRAILHIQLGTTALKF